MVPSQASHSAPEPAGRQMLDQQSHRTHPIMHTMVTHWRAWTRYTLVVLVVLVVLALTASSGAAQGNQTPTHSAGKGCRMRRKCTPAPSEMLRLRHGRYIARHAKRLDSCTSHLKHLHPPACTPTHTVGNVMGTNYVLAAVGRNSCPPGTNLVSQAECEAANRAMLPAGKSPGKSMQVGSWGDKPPGCSTEAGPGGDYSAHFNTRATGAYNGRGYALTCSEPNSAGQSPTSRHPCTVPSP